MRALSAGYRYLLPLIVAAYGVYLLQNEQRYRRQLAPAPDILPLPGSAAGTLPASNMGPLLAVLGFSDRQGTRRSTESVTVQGVFVGSQEQSRALLNVAGRVGSYRTGERLPGGGVVRRIDPDQVLLLRNGQEESLPLARGGQSLLRDTKALDQAPFLHLLPTNRPEQGEP